jgi:hypothetical protein
VSGARGPVWDVEVELTGLTHPNPAHLELLLVAPDGTHIPLMSDACWDSNFVDKTLIIKSADARVAAPGLPRRCPANSAAPRPVRG